MVGRGMSYRGRIQTVLNRIVKESDRKEGYAFKFEADRTVKNAYEAAFRIPIGYTYYNVKRQLYALSAACGGIVETDDRGGVVIVRVYVTDLPKSVPFVEADILHDRLLIGYNRNGEPVYHPLNTHLLVAGASRAGKTDWVRMTVYQQWLQGYEIYICDLKGFSFFPFEVLPRITIAKSIEESEQLLTEVYNELNRRKQIVQMYRSREIIKTFRPIAVIVDEGASLSPSQHSGKMKKIATTCDEIISVFGQQGREPKIFCIYATQRPDMDVINKQYKANVEASIAFRTKDETNSRIILGRGGAEKISPDTPGRCIYAYDRDHMLQVPYVGDDDAWDEVLAKHKTEVMELGTSERKPHDRIIIDAECAAIGDNGADRSADVQGPRQPGKASIRIALGSGRGETGRVSTDGRHAQGMAAQQARSSGSRMLKTSGTYEHDQDSSLVDDW
jgi:S-DNA-T family DNA segregation ATPase FtsK/SpoIIIE